MAHGWQGVDKLVYQVRVINGPGQVHKFEGPQAGFVFNYIHGYLYCTTCRLEKGPSFRFRPEDAALVARRRGIRFRWS